MRKMVHHGVDLQAVAPLTEDSYVPGGGTALLDAIGKTLATIHDRLMRSPAAKHPKKVIVAILTDGHENASKEYSRKTVFDMIARLRKRRSWEFLFLGANQDVFVTAGSLSIDRNASLAFQSDGQGTRTAFREMNLRFSISRMN